MIQISQAKFEGYDLIFAKAKIKGYGVMGLLKIENA